MTIGIVIAVIVGVIVLAGIAIATLRRPLPGERKGRSAAGTGATRRGKAGATMLEARDVFLAGINANATCGEHRQKLIRQCQAGDAVRLVRVTDDPRNPNAIAVHRADGRDIGMLPRKVASDIAEHLDNGTPVAATIRSIEPHEIDSGEILSGVRLELTPHRVQRRK